MAAYRVEPGMGPVNIRWAEPPAPRNQAVLFEQYLDDIVRGDDPVRVSARVLDEIAIGNGGTPAADSHLSRRSAWRPRLSTG